MEKVTPGSTSMTPLVVSEHHCSMMLGWVPKSRRPSPWHVTLNAASTTRSILIWRTTWQILNSSSSSSWSTSFNSVAGANSTFTTEKSENNELTARKYDSIYNGCECHGTSLRSLGNMHRKLRSISMAIVSTTSNHARTQGSQILINICMIPSVRTAWFDAVHKLGAPSLIYLAIIEAKLPINQVQAGAHVAGSTKAYSTKFLWRFGHGLLLGERRRPQLVIPRLNRCWKHLEYLAETQIFVVWILRDAMLTFSYLKEVRFWKQW